MRQKEGGAGNGSRKMEPSSQIKCGGWGRVKTPGWRLGLQPDKLGRLQGMRKTAEDQVCESMKNSLWTCWAKHCSPDWRHSVISWIWIKTPRNSELEIFIWNSSVKECYLKPWIRQKSLDHQINEFSIKEK